MHDFSARRGTGERGHTGIAKQVEHFGWSASGSDFFLRKIPMNRMLLKNTQMTERGTPGIEGQFVPAHDPFILRCGGQNFPVATIVVARLGIEHGVRLPAINGVSRCPESLRVRPDDALGAKAFEFKAMTAVEQGIVLPIISNQKSGLCLHQSQAFLAPG